ncbi:MAG: helix-hairpin-helix domain-containing protein [Cyclobacteriaceae bacterium]|nr:helix-hairpin-helix domain-containing protein [Cyclobacteriaceae bacterium]
MTKRWLAILLLIPLQNLAQDYPKKEINLERIADELFGFQDLDLNYEDLYENIALLLANPLNLNTATPEEFRFINILTEEQFQHLFRYRRENGNFLSVYELQAIPTFDLLTIYKIIPFVTVKDPSTLLNASLLNRIRKEGTTYLIMRYGRILETKRGFTDEASPAQRFIGDENSLYMRFLSRRTGDYSFGFTLEKDAGEQITWNPETKQYGFDFISFHAQLMNKGKIKNITVGDYQVQFGQGLMLGSKFGFGKGAETITTIRRSNMGFLPFTSIDETGYLRGACLTYELSRNILLSGFYSNTWRDATLVVTESEDDFASALQTSGLHRNLSEISRRKNLNEEQYGFILGYQKQQVDAGILFTNISYGVPIVRSPNPYNQYAFSGNGIQNIGGYLNYTFKNFTFFSEAGSTLRGGLGISSGLVGSVTSQLDVAFHYRNYQRNFYSLSSNAFAESSLPQNERGMYWGWRYRWNRKYSFAGYMDIFRFPWLRYRIYSPTDGNEYLLRFNYQPTRNVLLFAQFREETKSRNVSTGNQNTYRVENGTKRNVWLNADYEINRTISMKTRAQFSTYDFNDVKTRGMIILQDITLRFTKLAFTARYAIFDTKDYDNRQYVYERDVWLAFTMPALSGTGIRNYVLMQYDVSRKISCWLRYSHLRYTDREVVGSGADTIDGNARNDIKLQVRFRL